MKFGRNGRVSKEIEIGIEINLELNVVDRSCRFGKNTFSRKIT